MRQESIPVRRTSAPAGGKRLAKRRRKKRAPLRGKAAIVLAVVLLLFAGYAGLCAWAGAKLPANVAVVLSPSGQEVDLGGLTANQAKDLLARSVELDSERTLTVICAGQGADLDAGCFTADPDSMLQTLAQAEGLMISRPFLVRGLDLLMGRGVDTQPVCIQMDCSYRFTDVGEQQAGALLDAFAQIVAAEPSETTYTVGEESIEVVCGAPGAALNRDTARQAILDALAQGQQSVELVPDPVAPPALDAAALNEEIYTQAEPIKLGRDGAVTPAVVGVSIDVDAAQAALDAAAPGQTLSIPIVRTQPDYALADEEGLLYKDMLSECSSYVGGSSNRVFNVSLAASHCNGTVLMPGDEFSYHAAVGDCTVDEGYAVDLGFAGGKTVDMVGGGICQVSSSLYYCTVYANLEVVERRNHAFTVDYLPAGLDATFYSSTPDYRFRNNTGFPVKITAAVKDRTLTVRFFGTNPDGTYVKTERSQTATVPYTTEYKPDPEIPAGTTKVDVTPYTGLTIEVYRCVYAADGTLLSRTHENTSRYAARNKVVLYNPADAASLGLEVPPTESPSVEPPPVESPSVEAPPSESPAVEVPPSESPAVEAPPAESPSVEAPPEETSAAEDPSEPDTAD